MPRGALEDDRQISSTSLFKFLEPTGERANPILDLRGSFVPDGEAPPGRHTLRHDARGTTIGRYHLFVTSGDVLAPWIQGGECRGVASTEGAAAVFPDLKKSIARVLHASPALLGALPRFSDIAYRFPDDLVASLGIYVYGVTARWPSLTAASRSPTGPST